jgi:hypothetical protein
MGMNAEHLRVRPDGSLEPYSADAESMVLKLDLQPGCPGSHLMASVVDRSKELSRPGLK